ncbi:YdcF family protein [Agarivorans sp. QJM3NY_33]|uniref:YdcF family protein n=1 Tax=Agarivorans sp. QJM3NY_33 TaxID=3421432 RepID=UPI003D7CBD99
MSSFLFSKLLISLFIPSTLLWLLLLLAAICWLLGRAYLAKSLVFISLLLALVFSLGPLSGKMLRFFETQYPAMHVLPADTDLIVVLGCLHYVDKTQPLSSQVLPCATVKLVEAIRLWRQHPESQILLSGGDVEASGVEHADMLAKLAISLGVPDSHLLRSYHNLNTAAEAQTVAGSYRGKNIVLVTQAAHMPRAMWLFQQQGLKVTAAPSYYQVRNWQAPLSWRAFIPKFSNIAKADTAIYEALANLWLRARVSLSSSE